MWILSLEGVLVALLVFWATGVLKRLRRLRQQCKQAFAAVQTPLQAAHAGLLSAAERAGDTPGAQALQQQAHTLQAALQQAQARPWRESATAALRREWQHTQALWSAYAAPGSHIAPDGAEASVPLPDEWQTTLALYTQRAAIFDAILADYNAAITQVPACALARLCGCKPGQFLLKDAAQQVQPTV